MTITGKWYMLSIAHVQPLNIVLLDFLLVIFLHPLDTYFPSEPSSAGLSKRQFPPGHYFASARNTESG